MKWTIKDFAKKLNISENKLRYYEKQGLLVPKRTENNYRYYTETDLQNMEYILVMRYARFSIKDIKAFMELITQVPSPDCNQKGNMLFENKIKELEKTISTYQDILLLMKEIPMTTNYAILEKNYEEIQGQTNQYIKRIFHNIKD